MAVLLVCVKNWSVESFYCPTIIVLSLKPFAFENGCHPISLGCILPVSFCLHVFWRTARVTLCQIVGKVKSLLFFPFGMEIKPLFDPEPSFPPSPVGMTSSLFHSALSPETHFLYFGHDCSYSTPVTFWHVSLPIIDQDVSRSYSTMDGRHTPQSTRATPDREVQHWSGCLILSAPG